MSEVEMQDGDARDHKVQTEESSAKNPTGNPQGSCTLDQHKSTTHFNLTRRTIVNKIKQRPFFIRVFPSLGIRVILKKTTHHTLFVFPHQRKAVFAQLRERASMPQERNVKCPRNQSCKRCKTPKIAQTEAISKKQ